MSNTDLPLAVKVKLKNAVAPFVLAIDIGSGSTRCSLYDAYARPVSKRTLKADHRFIERADGSVEIDADQIASEVSAVISGVVDDLDPASIKAVVMDTFASSLVCVGADGDALTPCITYADSRSAAHLEQLRATLEEDEVHQRVGARLHTSYHPPKMLWLAEQFPDVMAKTDRFLSLGEYVYEKIAGIKGAARSTVAWSGMLNRHTGDMDELLLDATGTTRDQYADIVDPDEPIADVSPAVGRRWPALAGAVWLPAVPDGYASNLGVGASTPETAALSAATSGAMRVIVDGTPENLPKGLWSYSVSQNQSIVGGALNDVGRAMIWATGTFGAVTEEAINEKLRAAPQAGTPLVLPFLTGERATGWAAQARAVFADVSSASGPLDMWRGLGEGVAVAYARVFKELKQVNPDIEKVVASGGVSQHYPGLMDLLAQTFGFPVQVVNVKRVTMRGAAVLALNAVNPDFPVAPIPETELTHANPAWRKYFIDLQARFEKLYEEVID